MVDRPKKFDKELEGERVGDRLKYLGNYLNEVSNDFPTPDEWSRRWKDVKEYLLWLAVEG